MEPSTIDEELDRTEIRLADVETALARLEQGSYALCERCGGVIDDGQLALDPTERTCGAHGEGSEGS